MLEVLGFLVLIAGNIWFTLFIWIVGIHGGLDCSSPFSKYGTWKGRLGAIIVIAICAYFWYWTFSISPFVLKS